MKSAAGLDQLTNSLDRHHRGLRVDLAGLD